MDVLKWLEETEQPQVAQDTYRRKHSQKQSTSDSSLLEPLSLKVPSVNQEVRDRNAGKVPAASPSDSSLSSRYVRKPRRKTRPGRYEPNTPIRPRHKNKSSKARHKSARKNDQGPGQLVQSYRARNVSGHRLTLRPPELGLFNKGRTSNAARGRGLPDLVFSEMKFLQKHDEPKPSHQPEVSRKKRKTDHMHTMDEEISSFFTSGHHTLKKESKDKHSSHSSVGMTKRRHRDRTPVTYTVVPTVELDDGAPCLASENGRARHESTNHASWSESVRGRSFTPTGVQSGDNIYCDRHNPGRYEHPKSNTNRDESLLEKPKLPSVAKKTTGSANERFHVSSLAPSQCRMSRSQSCPQYSASSRRLNLVNRSNKLQQTEKARSSSSMLPAVPCIPNPNSNEGLSASHLNMAESRMPPNPGREAYATSQHGRLDNGHKGRKEELETSSDWEKLLQVCKGSIHDPLWAASTQTRDTCRPKSTFSAQLTRRQQMTDLHTSTRRIPTVRFAELPCQYQAQSSSIGPGIYEQQEQHQHPVREVYGGESFDDYPWVLDEEYMDMDNVLHHDEEEWDDWGDMDDILGASMLYACGEQDGMCIAGSPLAANNVREDPRPGNDVVAPRFWRPNKLY